MAHKGIGRILLKREDFPGAASSFSEAITLVPNSFSSNFGLALALAQNGKIDKARKAVNRALEIDPSHSGARQLLAQIDATK